MAFLNQWSLRTCRTRMVGVTKSMSVCADSSGLEKRNGVATSRRRPKRFAKHCKSTLSCSVAATSKSSRKFPRVFDWEAMPTRSSEDIACGRIEPDDGTQEDHHHRRRICRGEVRKDFAPHVIS